MVGTHGGAIPMEVVGTVIEMADMAWHALEHRKHHHARASPEKSPPEAVPPEEELERLRFENLRLRTQLENNLAVLQSVYKAPAFSSTDCPPDIYERLTASVESSNYLQQLESLHQESISDRKDPGIEEKSEDVSINVDGELSWWVWVTEKLDPQNLEEPSGIDNDSYVIITEENVVDGIAGFIARCILENPESKTLSPQELHKAVTQAIAGIKQRMNWKNIWEAGKVIYSLSTWGICLAGLYRHRAIVRVAAKGVGATSKLVMKML